MGEYAGSGFKDPPAIVRRADGQVIQLTRLLFLVAEQADGTKGYDDISAVVSEAYGKTVSPGNVRTLVEDKLRPLGVLAAADGSSPELERPDPLLALRFRKGFVSERAVAGLARLFGPLFHTPIVIAVLAGTAAVDVWLFGRHGLGEGLRDALYQPGFILLILGFVVISAAFHEIGHAAACAFSGAKPGRIGAGIYLFWPAFYTDVTDAYRLDRRGRLRTDLGGVYFNLVFILAMTGLYAVTGFEPLLLVVIFQHFEIVHQLLPVVRLDGYYIVSDLVGVPDLFSRMGPILRSALPWERADDRVRELKPWVRVVVTLWVLLVIPLLLFQVVMLVAHAPRIFATAWDSLGEQQQRMTAAFAGGDALAGVSGIVQMAALSLPILGIALLFYRLGQRAWSATGGKPVLRALLVVGALAFCAFTWWPNGDYRPIEKGERLTAADGIRMVRELPTGRAGVAPLKDQAEPGTATADRPEPAGATDAEATPATTSTTSLRTTTTVATSTDSDVSTTTTTATETP